MSSLTRLWIALALLVVGASPALAQSASGRGQVEGVVTDALTGETLIGVSISVDGTSIGASTDIDGRYVIRRVPAGPQRIVFSYIGFDTREEEVVVVAGETLRLDVQLGQDTIIGEEVVISAQAEGQREAINQQLQSDKIVNVVSEARIQELPDFNAAAALGRLPGVSTTKSSGEDNKVVIRGLSPEYNSIEIEGTQLASTGSSSIGFTSDVYTQTGGVNTDRSVDLTSISPYMIRMISVYKSLTPDMNANSIGGTVNMELREAPADRHYSAMWQLGYTAKSGDYGNYRAVLSGSDRFIGERFGVYALANIESYDRNADNLNAGYGIQGSDAEIDPVTGYRPVTVNQVTLNRHIETRDRYGANVIMDYRLPSGSIKFVNLLARIRSDYTDFNQSVGYNDGRMNWRLQQGVNVTDQQLHTLKLDYDLNWVNVDLSASYTASHNLLDDSPVLNANQTSAVRIDANRANLTPEQLIGLQDQFQGVDRIILRSANLYSSDYRENKVSYKADFEVPYTLGSVLAGSFKVGGQYYDQSNDLDQEAPYMGFDGNATSTDGGIANNMMRALMQEFGLTVNEAGSFVGTSFINDDEDLYDPFLDDTYGGLYFVPEPGILVDMVNYVIGNPLFDASNREQSTGRVGGWYDGPFQQLTNDYSYDERYTAAYAMTQFDLGPLFTVGGVRYEKVSSDYLAYNAEDIRNAQTQYMIDTTATSGNQFWLPMVQTRYTPINGVDLRYAYTHTLARPDYNGLSPKFTIPNGGGSVFAGNPDLQPALARNHDLNVTFYGNKLGLLSAGLFYKTISDFVYTARYSLDVAEDAGIDEASNYQIFCSQSIRDRFGDRYPTLATCEDGDELVSPSATRGRYIVPVSKPLNNPYDATVKGVELDFQHNFWYMPAPFNSMVFGTNYTRIYSEYQQPFYDRDEIVIGEGRDAIVIPVLVDSSFTGRLINQPNHVLNSYLGYDNRGFSVRLSLLFQSNSARGNGGLYPENDSYTDDYLRLDLSARQQIPIGGANLEVFGDVSNLNGANTRWVQRSTGGFQGIQNYGLTANLGLRVRY